MSKTNDAAEEEYSVEKVLNRRVRNGKVSSICLFFVLSSLKHLCYFIVAVIIYYPLLCLLHLSSVTLSNNFAIVVIVFFLFLKLFDKATCVYIQFSALSLNSSDVPKKTNKFDFHFLFFL